LGVDLHRNIYRVLCASAEKAERPRVIFISPFWEDTK
jgi:hypothetical protein